jgi:hypothetical protein
MRRGSKLIADPTLVGSDLKSHTKAHLPNWLSFPVGVQLLESALRDIPRLDELEISFDQQCGISATEFRQLIESGKPHVIVSAGFERWDKRPSIGTGEWEDFLRGVWTLRVFPVARQKKAAARALLVAEGLPILRRWFEASRPESWYWGRKRCDVLFDPLELSVTSQDINEAV